MTTVPFIPENAPFTPEQRGWLNGLLAGMFSSAPAPQPAIGKMGRRIAVLYASQSGTAESLARKLAKELKTAGHLSSVSTLVGYTPAALAGESCALILASTYGDGDAPDGVQPFYEQLCLEHFPRMEKLSYAVFALGDRHYEHFCRFGANLDAKLAALGANPLAKRVDSDVDVDGPFAEWRQIILDRLNEKESRGHGDGAGPVAVVVNETQRKTGNIAEPAGAEALAFSRERPLLAPLVEKRALTHPASTKVTMHLAFSTSGKDLPYHAGDAFGVIPNNDPILVAEILQLLRCNGNEQVLCGKAGMVTLHDALSHHLQITRLNRKTVQEYATRGQCGKLLELLSPGQAKMLEEYIYGRGFIDLLAEYPGAVDDPADLVAMLPRLTPRLYSISSSPAAHAGQVHLTVAVVRYSSHNRERGGVCSTLFADRTEISDRLPVYIQPNKKFRLPCDPDAPMIMIGPGTGIAPFRAFLHERRALGHKGKNWLFFGERSANTDFLYREELQKMCADRHLTRLDTAFSRDQERKIYVQDRMLVNAAMFWSWLEEGATVYVCGDASRMAKDVHTALCSIVEKQGDMNAEHAQEYVAALKDQHRYHRDVY